MILPPLNNPTAQSSLISTDRHWVAVEVGLNVPSFDAATQIFPDLRAETHSSVLTVHAAGDLALNSAFNIRSEQDLQRADVSIPAALILLVIVFGSVVAALLCLGIGLVAVAGGLAAMYTMAHVGDVSTYALNVVVILGLGVAIDYSLFIVSRFREELDRQPDLETALSVTMRTAGTAVAVSGITVAVGATALLFYSGTILTSMGLSGSFMVLIAVVYALSFLPALLAILGKRVNHWRPASLLRPFRRSPVTPLATAGEGPLAAAAAAGGRGPEPVTRGFWARLANLVMRRPVAVLVPCLAVLLLAGSPLSQIRLAEANVTLLPPGDDARQGTELLTQRFGQGDALDVVLDFHGSPYSAANVATAYQLGQRLTTFPGISGVTSYVNVPGVTGVAAYQELYANGTAGLPAAERAQVTQLTGTGIAVLRAYTQQPGGEHGPLRPRPRPGRRGSGHGHRQHRLRHGLRAVHAGSDPRGGRVRHGHDLPPAHAAAPLRGPPLQSGAHEPALPLSLLRGARLHLPAGPPERFPGLQPGTSRPHHPRARLLRRLWPLHGLRGLSPDPDARGVAGARRQPARRRRGAAGQRPAGFVRPV